MKRVLICCAALIAAPAAAQNAMDLGQDGPPVKLAGYEVPRDMPVTPPGMNTQTRAVPPAIAAVILDALEDYDYPRCSAMIKDRCVQ